LKKSKVKVWVELRGAVGEYL